MCGRKAKMSALSTKSRTRAGAGFWDRRVPIVASSVFGRRPLTLRRNRVRAAAAHEPLDEGNEGARLGAGEAARRVDHPQIARRQGPILQNRNDLSGSELG